MTGASGLRCGVTVAAELADEAPTRLMEIHVTDHCTPIDSALPGNTTNACDESALVDENVHAGRDVAETGEAVQLYPPISGTATVALTRVTDAVTSPVSVFVSATDTD